MGGGIEEGIETMSSNDTADENEVTSPGRMSKPRGVAFFGCLGLGLFAAFMGVGVIIGRSFEKKANASQVSTVASQNTHVWNSGKNNYGQSGTGSNDMEEWYEPELWHGKSAKTGESCYSLRLISGAGLSLTLYLINVSSSSSSAAFKAIMRAGSPRLECLRRNRVLQKRRRL